MNPRRLVVMALQIPERKHGLALRILGASELTHLGAFACHGSAFVH